jgi:hypothetical protein
MWRLWMIISLFSSTIHISWELSNHVLLKPTRQRPHINKHVPIPYTACSQSAIIRNLGSVSSVFVFNYGMFAVGTDGGARTFLMTAGRNRSLPKTVRMCRCLLASIVHIGLYGIRHIDSTWLWLEETDLHVSKSCISIIDTQRKQLLI